MEPYYADDLVTLWLGDCRDVLAGEGRRAVGVEINEAFCEVTARRLSQDTLFGGVA